MIEDDFKIICEEVPIGSVAKLNPELDQKVVFLVRHGQASHNCKIKEGEQCPCMYGKPNCPYLNSANEDARLTQRGRLQATTVGAKLVHTKPVPEVVLVSPLYRTLQTCSIALSTLPHLQVPVIAMEGIRERCGLHVCDKRSDKSKLEKVFESIDFSHIQPGEDALFLPQRETVEQTAKRGKAFLLSLRSRPETSIALFSHSSLLFNTLSQACETPDPLDAILDTNHQVLVS